MIAQPDTGTEEAVEEVVDEKAPRRVELLEKKRPQQARAIRTYESILDAASELLVEVGLERISTNLIAERAGITVPALYRYFPNKYSVLNALGSRLMDRQNAAMFQWHELYIAGQPPERVMECMYELLVGQYQVSADLVGGLQIMHVLQSIAPLQQVRLDSHWQTGELLARLWCEQFDVECTDEIQRQARVAVELGYAAIQIALEDDRILPEVSLREGGRALRLYLESVMRDAGVKLS